MKFILAILLLQLALVFARPASTKGKYFDRVVIIIFENQDYKVAAKDKYLSMLTSKYKGFALTNYLATTHPSQPNYVSFYKHLNRYSFIDCIFIDCLNQWIYKRNQ